MTSSSDSVCTVQIRGNANRVNPVDYLADVLMRMQTHPDSRIDELLPHKWKPPGPQPSA